MKNKERPICRKYANNVEYKGIVYVRPCGRGLTLLNSDDRWDIDDLFDDNEYYEITITAKKLEGYVDER